jgi:nuclear GTP-binding protein
MELTLQPVAAELDQPSRNLAAIMGANTMDDEVSEAGPSSVMYQPVDTGLTRDSSSKAFMRELRKVVERSDVVIQVLDARDPEGTRSRWVEEEVRKRESQGKKLLGVVNKIGQSRAQRYRDQS